MADTIARLELPIRWELLAQRAEEAGLDVTQFVERVDEAAEHVDELLGRVRTGGGGLFEVIYGLSGSGKTTFLNTLPKFFSKLRVHSFPSARDLSALPEFIRETYVPGDDHSRIILIERRDNPKKKELEQIDEVFADLIDTFREPSGRAVVLWPITNPTAAEYIAAAAWKTGRDSMSDPTTKGRYIFNGVPRQRYFSLADATTRNLTGDGLEAFGVTDQVSNGLLSKCETIADFFNQVDKVAASQRDRTYAILKARVSAKLWILLPGDDVTALNATVSALVQGAKNKIDIDKIGELLDDPNNKALYISEWRTRRAELAHLLRAIDTRLFLVAPNVALAAVRCFGDDATKRVLKQPALNVDQAKTTMRASKFYKTILSAVNVPTSPYAGPALSSQRRETSIIAFRKLLRKATNNSMRRSAIYWLPACRTTHLI